MGQILPGSARTTEAVRRTIQSLNVLAKQYGINPKTVSKWRKRDFVHDAPMGSSVPASTVLKPEEEAMCVAFGGIRSCFWTIAFMRCSPRSRICHARPGNCCYQRHGISRLPDVEGDYEYICKIGTKEPERFNVEPFQHTVGLKPNLIKQKFLRMNALLLPNRIFDR